MKITAKTPELKNPIIRFWKWWFTTRATDPTVAYRERALRIFLPLITVLRAVAISQAYSSSSELVTPYFPGWVAVAAFLIPVLFSFIFLAQQKIDWAGASFLALWYLTDLLNLPAEGYWYPGFQISLIIQVILATLLLQGRAILPFMFFQLISVGAWSLWLDENYFTPPLLASGEPVAIFRITIIALAAQEAIILFIVRYLRMQLEKYLRLQQEMIQKLEQEIVERQRAEARLRGIFIDSPDVILEIDRAGTILLANRHADLFSGNPVFQFVQPDFHEQIKETISQAYATGENTELELQIYETDGSLQWNSVRIGPVLSNSQVTSLVAIITNIQAQKEAALSARQHARQLATIVEIGHAVSTLQDLDTILEIIYQQIQHIAPVDAFFICLYDKDKNRLTFPLTYDLGIRYDQADSRLTPGSPLDLAIKTGEPYLLHRTAENLAELEKTPGDVGNQQRRSASLLYLPLWQAQNIIGALSIQSYTLNAYPGELINNLMGIADQAAIAIQNARLFTSIQQELAERKRAEEQITLLNQELEQRVRERTRELVEANREMESFSYSVSHDLRAPLRAINGYAQILRNELPGDLAPTAKAYLEKIRNAGNKMGQLIDALLAFSRLGRSQINKQDVDMRALAQNTIDSLSPETDGRQIEWLLTDLPPARADQTLLQQVFANLISNAIKYSGKQDKPRIEISCLKENDQDVFYIRDNGVGFNMDYAGKLFGVFQRLHSEDQFEGTGIGLATVQRIIHRHGGRIWAESEPDKGATFYFTLD